MEAKVLLIFTGYHTGREAWKEDADHWSYLGAVVCLEGCVLTDELH